MVTSGSAERIVTATRRFLALPSAVSLSATGILSPCPTTVMRDGGTPASANRRTTAPARAADSSQFEGKAGRRICWLSVCPSTCKACGSFFSSTASAASASRESGARVASPESNSTLALISTETPRLFWVTRTLPSLTSGARVEVKSRASAVSLSRSRRMASARRLAMMFGRAIGGVISARGPAVPTAALPPKALPRASERVRYLPSLTTETAYMTTKKANSRVMKSA